ncbi:MAG: spore coat U domain-containing protein [Burkholderiales bacterium]|jgi:spore coat protein U-like protein
MKSLFKLTSILFSAITLFGVANVASAQTQTGSIGVSATVGTNCVVSTSAISFGTYDPAAVPPTNGTGTVALVCTTGATPSIAVNLGANPNATQRRLTSGANTLNYNVFQPTSNAAGAACAYTTAFPTTAPGFALTAAPSTASRTYNICGQIPAAQSGAAAGTYSDTLTVTVSF